MSVLPIWRPIDSPTSRGSRPTQMYVTAGSLGIPSSGVWVLMNRRCLWAPNGGYLRAAAEALVGGQGSADGEDALTSCLPVR
jgi:hypothetical protein